VQHKTTILLAVQNIYVALSFTGMAMSHWKGCVKQVIYYLQILCVFMNMGLKQICTVVLDKSDLRM
jgi:hypothetical protein